MVVSVSRSFQFWGVTSIAGRQSMSSLLSTNYTNQHRCPYITEAFVPAVSNMFCDHIVLSMPSLVALGNPKQMLPHRVYH